MCDIPPNDFIAKRQEQSEFEKRSTSDRDDLYAKMTAKMDAVIRCDNISDPDIREVLLYLINRENK